MCTSYRTLVDKQGACQSVNAQNMEVRIRTSSDHEKLLRGSRKDAACSQRLIKLQ